ncbi:MAG: hypothetical protein JOZ65_28370 [Chloroflexi bacterium]|nr:hypothetical protein [Chloroflexota bacterium]
MIFFYEFLFVLVAVVAVIIGEAWSRLAAFVFVAVWFAVSLVGYASFGARLTVQGSAMSDDERRWFTDARDGMRHLRLLFGLATLGALAWRLIAG